MGVGIVHFKFWFFNDGIILLFNNILLFNITKDCSCKKGFEFKCIMCIKCGIIPVSMTHCISDDDISKDNNLSIHIRKNII